MFKLNDNNTYSFLLLSLILVYIVGLFLPLMENDSAQHATMAMRMVLTGDFEYLYRGTEPYLDKPHMHFWLAALSLKTFGIHVWAYRIPAVLFIFLGAYSVNKLAQILYKKEAGILAALVFLSVQAIILSAHDVRTDAVLTGAAAWSIWQYIRYFKTGKISAIVLGSIAMAIAFSSKGQIGVFVIGVSLICFLLYDRSWNRVFHWKIIIAILTFAICIIPVVYAYNVQFGEKGVRFILLEQSLDRLSKQQDTNGRNDYFYFFHTLLWVFLPWALLFYLSWIYRAKQVVKLKFKKVAGVEFLTVGSFLIVVLAFNMSSQKLPHYINSLLPNLSILTAGFVWFLHENKHTKYLKIYLIIQKVLAFATIIFVLLLTLFVFPFPSSIKGIIISVFLIILIGFIFKKSSKIVQIMAVSVLTSVVANLTLNLHFYPKLLNYQVGDQLIQKVEKNNIPVKNLYVYDSTSWTMDFYAKQRTPVIRNIDSMKSNNFYALVYQNQNQDFKEKASKDFNIDTLFTLDEFRVTRLSLKFLDPKRRAEQLKKAKFYHLSRKE